MLTPTLPLVCCVILGELLDILPLQFPQLKTGNNITMSPTSQDFLDEMI